MKLPNAELALVEERKISGYLLSDWHEDGRSKAGFFRRFGFRAEQWEMLAQALRAHAAAHAVSSIRDTPLGRLYTVDGELVAPDGRRPLVRTVWFINAGSEIPRVVSAYPHTRGRR